VDRVYELTEATRLCRPPTFEMREPSSTHVDVLPSLTVFPICIPCCIRSCIRIYSLSITRTRPRARDIREQSLYVTLSVAISLGSVGLIRNLPNDLGILRGEVYPSTHILLEVLLFFFCRLRKDYRSIRSWCRTHRKSSDTRDWDGVLSLCR
jgi:hypothetical protein